MMLNSALSISALVPFVTLAAPQEARQNAAHRQSPFDKPFRDTILSPAQNAQVMRGPDSVFIVELFSQAETGWSGVCRSPILSGT